MNNSKIYDLMTNKEPSDFIKDIDNDNLYDSIKYFVENSQDQNFEIELKTEEIIDAMYDFLTQKQYCLNCFNELDFSSSLSITCENCSWRNEIDADPVIVPITLKKLTFRDYSVQICYPPIERRMLEYLPTKLRKAVFQFLSNPNELTKKQYDNIFTNLYNENLSKMISIRNNINSRIELAQFFKRTNFLRRSKA